METKPKPVAIEAKLINKKHLTADVVELHFECNPRFHFEPGQYLSVVVPGAGPGGRDLRRAYSIASEPERPTLELCIKVVESGPGSGYLNSLQVGDSIKGNAPFGHFVFKTHHQKHVIFIATGTGIAPFRSMIFSKVYQDATPASSLLLFGARNQSELLYSEEIVAKLGRGNFIEALSRPSGDWTGYKGRVTDWIRENQESIDWPKTEFYLCGNGAMIDEIKQILIARGVEKSCIHQEAYYKPKPGETHASQ